MFWKLLSSMKKSELSLDRMLPAMYSLMVLMNSCRSAIVSLSLLSSSLTDFSKLGEAVIKASYCTIPMERNGRKNSCERSKNGQSVNISTDDNIHYYQWMV